MMVTIILKVLAGLYILQSLAKFVVHFVVKYDARRKRIDAAYKREAVGVYDDVVLLLCVALVVLLVISGIQYLSFVIGMLVGMTLIQTYFHRFSRVVPEEKAPPTPYSPIKLMSYAIQADPRLALREYLLMTVLLIGSFVALFVR